LSLGLIFKFFIYGTKNQLMMSIPVFRRTGARVPKLSKLVATVNNTDLISKVHADKKYGLSPDTNATYNNPATEETIRSKATPKVKEMKGQLVSSLKTQTLSPTTSVKSPVTGLPRIYTTVASDSTVVSPGRTILSLPGQSGTKISSLAEISAVRVPQTFGEPVAAKPVTAKPVVTSLTRPKNLNIDPSRIGYRKGSGKNGTYTVRELKNILRGLGQPLAGNKTQLVYTLVEYLRQNDPDMYSKLSDTVKNR